MANICTNQYRFVFASEEKAKKFFDFVNGETKSIYNLGVAAKISDAENRDIREWVDDADFGANHLEVRVNTQSKWVPFVASFDEIAKTFDDQVKTYFEAEEPGCEIFVSNDPEFVGKYVFDVWDGSEIELPEEILRANYIEDEDEVVKHLNHLLHHRLKDAVPLINFLNHSEYKDSVFVHEIQFSDIQDWE